MGCNMVLNRHKIIPPIFLILFSFLNLIFPVGEKVVNFLAKSFITPHLLQCNTALHKPKCNNLYLYFLFFALHYCMSKEKCINRLQIIPI